MNYIKQLNEFYYILDYTPISSNAILVYEMLLHIANKAGWSSEFKVPNIILMGKTRLCLGAIQRARNELLNCGLITYKKGSNGAQAPKYKIIKLYTDNFAEANFDVNNNTNVGVNADVNSNINSDVNSNDSIGINFGVNSNIDSDINFDTRIVPNNDMEVERSCTKYSRTAKQIISDIVEIAEQKNDSLTDNQIDRQVNRQVDSEPITLINKTKRNKTIKEKNKKEIASDLYDVLNANVIDSDIKNTLVEFIKMRKSNKKPLTARGLELIIKKLDKLTEKKLEKIEILNNSIMNNWQGVFPLSEEQKKSLTSIANAKIDEYEILDSSQEENYVRPKYD